jgi:hypothetical protein
MVAVSAKGVMLWQGRANPYLYCPDDIAVNVSSTRLMAKDFPGWRKAADRGDGRLPKLRRYYYEQRLHGRGVFMEELLAELGRRGVAFQAEEVGKKNGTGGDC